MYQYPLGTPVPFNPSFILVAENVKGLPGIQSAQDYLEGTKISLENSQVQYEFPTDMYSEQIDNVLFDIMELQLDLGSVVVKQKYYAALIKDYALSFVVSYSTQEELDALNEIVKSVKFSVN